MLRLGRKSVFALLFALAACSGPCSSPMPIVSVDVVRGSETMGLVLSDAVAEARAMAAAQALERFAVRRARTGEVGWQLLVQIRLATERTDDEDPSKLRRALGAAAELRSLGPVDGPNLFRAEALEIRTVSRGTSADPHLRETIDLVMARLETSIRLAQASAGEVAEAILSDDPHARAVATQMAKDRRLVEVRPALEGRLAASELSMQEALRLAGALAEVGGPSSATAVIDLVSRFPEATVPLLYVLARIGGREASGFLFTVKSGHSSPEVRRAAEEALRQLEANEGEGVDADR